ncbi:6-methylsalicylate decarboxylase [Hyphomicrobium sp. 1Nfss2.1]|uniref:amidohydrolase family protein n=1 Tax=Hyphomicrobium sp. 1Nfss2.1 TaxID=3413936 RepID=UPI003C7CAD15
MKIDVHAHLYPVAYLDLLDSFGGTAVGTAIARGLHAGPTAEDIERRLAMMDKAGVDVQILSVSPQDPYFPSLDQSVKAARLANDICASAVAQGRGRFAAFASLPLPHIDASVAEMKRCYDELGMIGVSVSTTILGAPLADARFDGLFSELDGREAVVFIHPSGVSLASFIVTNSHFDGPLGSPFEDTVCALQLIQARVPERFPRIKFISSHLGGCLPFLMKRIDVQARVFMPTPALPSEEAKRFWYDTVNAHPAALRCACETFGSDRLLLGTDTPYWQDDLYNLAVDYIRQSGLSAQDAERIYHENAAALFGDKLSHAHRSSQ